MAAKDIVEKFGGQTALAKLLGIGQSNIAYWVKSGLIPNKWHTKLLSIALERNIDLSPADLISGLDSLENSNSYTQSTDVDSLTTSSVNAQFLFYASDGGAVKVQVAVSDETVWASQKGMAEIFNVEVQTINYHLKEIFASEELKPEAVIRKLRITAFDNKNYEVNFYNLDAIISIGYRVNSYQATQFRKWATSVLREYLIKGFTLDDERLKQANQLFSKDYFDELLERIREIRASERRFYQKITDIYSQCSVDYDKNAPITLQFYAHVQDKLHYAIHKHTAAELIKLRADVSKPNMGLTSWKAEKTKGKIATTDIKVGKNYLSHEELTELNRLVSMFLDFAENFVRRQMPLTMQDWVKKLDEFLIFNAYAVLDSYGKVKRETAELHAIKEFEKFRVIQDKNYKSDFDKVIEKVKFTQLPSKKNK